MPNNLLQSTVEQYRGQRPPCGDFGRYLESELTGFTSYGKSARYFYVVIIRIFSYCVF